MVFWTFYLKFKFFLYSKALYVLLLEQVWAKDSQLRLTGQNPRHGDGHFKVLRWALFVFQVPQFSNDQLRHAPSGEGEQRSWGIHLDPGQGHRWRLGKLHLLPLQRPPRLSLGTRPQRDRTSRSIRGWQCLRYHLISILSHFLTSIHHYWLYF